MMGAKSRMAVVPIALDQSLRRCARASLLISVDKTGACPAGVKTPYAVISSKERNAEPQKSIPSLFRNAIEFTTGAILSTSLMETSLGPWSAVSAGKSWVCSSLPTNSDMAPVFAMQINEPLATSSTECGQESTQLSDAAPYRSRVPCERVEWRETIRDRR